MSGVQQVIGVSQAGSVSDGFCVFLRPRRPLDRVSKMSLAEVNPRPGQAALDLMGDSVLPVG